MSILSNLRRFELNLVRSYFGPGIKVLEIGGGSGYQAQLRSFGAEVQSIDVAIPERVEDRFYQVRKYDGGVIPFESESFDIVFSSNVLEHVKDLKLTLSEIHRVIKPQGLVIHILPTPAWRLWTSLGHYLHHCRRLFSLTTSGEVASAEVGAGASRHWTTKLGRALVAVPHGEYPSAISELWYFSARRWAQVFQKCGMAISESRASGIFYTGYALFPEWSVDRRKKLSKWLGSSTRIFVMRKRV